MNEINDSDSHLLDGIDPDAPRNREYHPASWQARQLCQDLQDLREMDEADKRHYSATPGGSRHNSISRGQ